jgi:riboflavin kinase/FMN adenylyltransferase
MKVLAGTKPPFKKRPPSIATIGIFDGLHRGHAYILKKVIGQAKRGGLSSLLVGLFPHPLSFYNQEFSGYITTQKEKVSLLKGMGLDYFLVLRFNNKIAKMKGSKFLDYLLKYFKIKRIIVAKDFRFGYKARNSIKDLESLCRRKAILLEEIEKRKIGSRVINSSLIRRLIKRGDFKGARLFLGREYSISGPVLRSKGVGKRVLGTPTVNLSVDRKVLPPRGIYITKIRYKDRYYKSVSNLGIAPTFKKRKVILETNIFNFNKKIYNQVVEVIFLKRLRPERKFATAQDLRAQIRKDISCAQSFFARHAS